MNKADPVSPEPTAVPPVPPGGPREPVEHHRNGSVHARGRELDGEPHGYWEWWRTDGTLKRSGHFDRGRQVGEWTTYDRNGVVYKVTDLGEGNGTDERQG
jgi:antitoxin component YwqK of YwqJK toxin-antitoxin module